MNSRLLALLFVIALPHAARAADAAAPGQQAVLVTGASSGIGLRIAGHLAAQGHYVYAGARKDEDLAMLNAMDNVEAVRLDVNVPEQIEAAVAQVRSGGRPLRGIVNNAGVGVLWPLIEAPEQELDFQFQVNVYGPYRVTKAFAPLLIENRGRVTTIGSISGILSGPLFGVYSMSKHAVEAYTDSLAAEMARFGVAVSVVEPGNYRSDIGRNLVARFERQGYDYEASAWREEFERIFDFVEQNQGDEDGADPIAVARAVEHALFSDAPKRRYLVVPNQREAEITIRKAIEEMVQLNQGHEYSYDRDTLVKMLDETLAAQGAATAPGADARSSEAAGAPATDAP